MTDERQLALVQRGCESYDEGEFEAALELFLQAYESGERWVGLNVGNTLNALARPREALPYFRAAGEEDLDAMHNLASTYEDLGELGSARGVYEELVSAGYPKAFHALAWLEREQDPERAEELMRRVLEDEEIGELAAGVLGHWLWHEEREGARGLLERGKDAYPSAREDLANALLQEGRVQEARELLEAGIESGEEGFSLLLGNIAWDEDEEIEEAESWYRRGAAAGDPHSMENLAILLEDDGREDEAEEWWEAAVRAGVTDSKRRV